MVMGQDRGLAEQHKELQVHEQEGELQRTEQQEWGMNWELNRVEVERMVEVRIQYTIVLGWYSWGAAQVAERRGREQVEHVQMGPAQMGHVQTPASLSDSDDAR